MKIKIILVCIFFLFVVCVGCGTKKSSSEPNPVWDGIDIDAYCSLGPIQNLKVQIQKDFTDADRSIRENIKNGEIQEMIWLLEKSDNAQDKASAQTLKLELTERFTNRPFKILPNKLGGTLKKYLLDFGDDVYGLFKSSEKIFSWSDGGAEVAAYKLDQMLGTNLVPLTVERTIDGEKGTIQYFFRNARDGEVGDVHLYSFGMLQIFDYIIGNRDRHIQNILFLPKLNQVVAIDNGASFKAEMCGDCVQLKKYLDVYPKLKERIKLITKEQVEKELGGLLSADSIDHLMNNIDKIR
ncbi:MAG: hypothetical protein HQK53_03990 [Oligoflexia bacterium]|nr:hypothetical protein [Oligoflexia bacterium]